MERESAQCDFVLEMKGICKAFPGVQALDNVDFSVLRGEVHALVGENGAGKSTLMKILAGAYRKDKGEIRIEGRPVEINDPRTALDLGIAVIYQEFNLVPHLSAAENILLGRAPALRPGWVNWARLEQEAEKVLTQLGVSVPVKSPVKHLSVAQRQVVEIAKALATNAKILVMDEPSAVLGENDLERLFAVIKRLAAQGTTVVYISHRLSEIFRISDHVTVMKDGKVVGTYRTQDITSSDLVKLMVGRDVGNIYPARNARIGETVLEVKNLKRSGVLKDVSLSVRKGEIVGIAGLVGAGRTELARAIFGADPVDGGEVYVGGKRLMRSTPASRIRAGLGLLPEDRRGQGLVLSMDVSENVTLANIRAVGRVGILSPRREKDVVRSFVKKLRIKTPSLTTKVRTLSGGNQQKVALAKWLNAHCKVLIVDEPTRGIDVGAKHEIYELLNSLAESGVAILMISSELPEILGMCDRVLVMHEGELVGALSREEATEEKIMALATGMERQHR